MMTPEEDDTEKIPRSFRGGLYHLLRAPEAVYTAGLLLTGRAEDISARVLLMLWLPLTAFRMVPISSCCTARRRSKKTCRTHLRSAKRDYF